MFFADALKAEVYRTQAVEYLKRWLFVPYLWGGDDPLAGVDCSGLIMEVLKAVGLAGEKEDLTAAGIYEKFKDCVVAKPYAGVLVFWKRPNGFIVHVGMMIDSNFFIHAASGDSTTKDLKTAIAKNAYVQMRELESYSRARYNAYAQTMVFVDPFKVDKSQKGK